MYDDGTMNATAVPSVSSRSVSADTGSGHSGDRDLLVEWLGTFWRDVYEDPEFVGAIQGARALRAAQLYLDALEAMDLRNRENAPVFHRERWHPLVIRRSMRNVGARTMFRVGDDSGLRLGEQDAKLYPEHTVVEVGTKKASFRGMVVYPLDGVSSGIESVLTCAANSVAGATVVLGRGASFEILDGAIAIAEEDDPFDGLRASEFPKFEIPAGDGSEADEETVLWLSDALFDMDFVHGHLSYAMGLGGQSTEVCKRVVNAAWNAVASGCTPLLLKSLFACICGLPVVEDDNETVEAVETGSDDWTVVLTDRNAYRLPPGSEPKPGVVPGAVLRRFDTLDNSVHVYPCARELDREAVWREYVADMDEFKRDVPVVDMPPALFRSGVEDGFRIGWDEVDVYCAGPDANGNPKLWFYMDGLEEDNAAFWEGVWSGYEASGKSMEDVLPYPGESEDGTMPKAGQSCGKVVPMDFFMRNLIGANTLVVTVRTDAIAEDAPLWDPRYFGVLLECVPACVRLYVMEHCLLGGEPDSADTEDSADAFAHDDAEDLLPLNSEGLARGMSDSAKWRWVAACE